MLDNSIKLYVILPVHNRKSITEDFVKLCLKQTYINFTLLLIDDGSVDGTVDMVKSYIPENKLLIVRGKGNWYWGGSLHQAHKFLKNNKKSININKMYVLIMNDDTEFDEYFFEKGVKLLSESEKSIILPQSYIKNGNIKKYSQSCANINWNKFMFYDPIISGEKIQMLSTRGLFLKLKDFIELRGFHPVLIPHYLSDYEFTYRAYKKGFDLIISNSLQIYENEKTSRNNSYIEGFSFNKKKTNYIIAFIFFILKHAPLKAKIIIPLRAIFKKLKKLLLP
jgi:GT2 family glycosyltransferase